MDADRIVSTLVAGLRDGIDVAPLYAEDAILDANVPDWRFQLKGAREIAAKVAEPDWWPRASSPVVERTTVAGDTIVFELCTTFPRDGGTWLSRNAHILALDADGRIARHTMYCTGDWSPEQIVRQAAEAPMVE